jgi:hypothetical protein
MMLIKSKGIIQILMTITLFGFLIWGLKNPQISGEWMSYFITNALRYLVEVATTFTNWITQHISFTV